MESEKQIPEAWIAQSGIVLYLLRGAAESYRAAYVTANVTDLTGYAVEEALATGLVGASTSTPTTASACWRATRSSSAADSFPMTTASAIATATTSGSGISAGAPPAAQTPTSSAAGPTSPDSSRSKPS